MQQKLVEIFLQQEDGAFGNRKEKATPKIERYVYYIFTKNICSACNPMQVVVFCKNVFCRTIPIFSL